MPSKITGKSQYAIFAKKHGIIKPTRYGLNLPHRVLVRSTSVAIRTSLIISQIPAINVTFAIYSRSTLSTLYVKYVPYEPIVKDLKESDIMKALDSLPGTYLLSRDIDGLYSVVAVFSMKKFSLLKSVIKFYHKYLYSAMDKIFFVKTQKMPSKNSAF